MKRHSKRTLAMAKRRRFQAGKSRGSKASHSYDVLVQQDDVAAKVTVIPDLTDDATYRRLRAEAAEELREDRFLAQRRAFKSLLGLR